MSGVDTAALADELAARIGSKYAGEAMRLLEQEPDLVLAWLQDRGRLQRTKFAYRNGRTGYPYGRQPTRDIPPAAVSAEDNPSLPVLWIIR